MTPTPAPACNPLLKLDNQLCFSVYALSRLITKAYQPLLEALEVTYPQYLVLLLLWEHAALTVKELGEKLLLDSGTLTPLLKRMEQRGWLSRRRAEHDERSVIVTIQPAGLAHVALDQLGLLPYRLGPALAVGVGVSTLVSGSVGFITLLSVARAIQALATNRDKFRRLSATDDLSGLLNRRAFFAAMHRAPEASLILFDVDNFKTINDRHGHAAGDAAIRSIGRLLGSAPDAIAGRLGGEEFGVLLPGQDLANAWRTAERLRTRVARIMVKAAGATITLTVSGGVAAAEAGQGVDDLYRRCDGFLYAAKAHGRNRVLAALPDEPVRACA